MYYSKEYCTKRDRNLKRWMGVGLVAFAILAHSCDRPAARSETPIPPALAAIAGTYQPDIASFLKTEHYRQVASIEGPRGKMASKQLIEALKSSTMTITPHSIVTERPGERKEVQIRFIRKTDNRIELEATGVRKQGDRFFVLLLESGRIELTVPEKQSEIRLVYKRVSPPKGTES